MASSWLYRVALLACAISARAGCGDKNGDCPETQGHNTSPRRVGSVRERRVNPRPVSPAEVLAASSGNESAARVLSTASQSVTINAPDGQSSFTFDSMFTPKACETLSVQDLPHLTASAVQQIADAFKPVPAPKPLCIAVFGVLIVNSGLSQAGLYAGYSQEAFTQFTANAVAELLDQDMDGTPDDAVLMPKMRSGPGGSWIHAKRTGINFEDSWSSLLGKTVQVSEEHDFASGITISDQKCNLLEEPYHTYQHARERAYPSIFGFEDTPSSCDGSNPQSCSWQGSLAKRCSILAQCDWYKHDETTCSQGTITGGGCSTPSCAGLEWDWNVEMALTNQYALSHGMPGSHWQTGADMEAKLTSTGGACIEFLAALKDSKYHVMQKPFTFNYRSAGSNPTSGTSGSATSGTSGSATSGTSGSATSGTSGSATSGTSGSATSGTPGSATSGTEASRSMSSTSISATVLVVAWLMMSGAVQSVS